MPVPWNKRQVKGKLDNLWDHTGDLGGVKTRDLCEEEIRDLIRQNPVRFVVANQGDPLVWTESNSCYRFWKGEVQPHLCQPRLRGYQPTRGYCYTASEWRLNTGELVVALEINH